MLISQVYDHPILTYSCMSTCLYDMMVHTRAGGAAARAQTEQRAGLESSAAIQRRRASSPAPEIHVYRDPTRADELRSTPELDEAFLVVHTALFRVVCMRCLIILHPDDAGTHACKVHRHELGDGRTSRDQNARLAAIRTAVRQVFESAEIEYPPPKPRKRPQDLLDSSTPRPPAALPVPEHLLQNTADPPEAVQPFSIYKGVQCTTCLRCYRTEKAFQDHLHKARKQEGDTHADSPQDCRQAADLQRFSKELGLNTFIRVCPLGPDISPTTLNY